MALFRFPQRLDDKTFRRLNSSGHCIVLITQQWVFETFSHWRYFIFYLRFYELDR